MIPKPAPKLKPKLRVCVQLDSKLCERLQQFMTKAHHMTAPPAILDLVRMGLAVFEMDDEKKEELSKEEEEILKQQ